MKRVLPAEFDALSGQNYAREAVSGNCGAAFAPALQLREWQS